MTVSEAMNSRASIRDFLPTPVPEDVLRRVLSTASRAPSGGNLQPWHIDIVSGEKLDQLKALMQQTLADVASGAHSEAREYDIYPKELAAPYRDYRFKVGEDMYARLGIPREDKAARLQWFARLDNAANRLAYSATSFLTQSAPGRVPLPGRSLRLGVRVAF